jgi:hypothetical protein
MFDYLERLRAKSIREKQNFALLVSGGVTAIIFIIWISAFMMSFKETENQAAVGSNPSPFSEIKKQVQDTIAGAKERF